MEIAVGRHGRRGVRTYLLAATAALLACALPASAANFTVTPTDDAVVTPSGKRIGQRVLVVGSGGAAYLRFQLPATSRRVVSARLVMRATRASRARRVVVRPLTSGWDERSLAWGRRPRALAAGIPARVRSGRFVVDVTRSVRAGKAAFSVRSLSGAVAALASREALVAHTRPRLVVTYEPDPGASVAGDTPADPPTWNESTDEMFMATVDHAFVGRDGQPMLMNGVNTRDAVTLGNPWTYSRQTFATLQSQGFNSVRIPLDWNDFETARGQFSVSSLSTLDQAITNATDAGLHVILDPIHLKGADRLANVPAWALQAGDDSISVVQREAHRWVAVIAERYGRTPGVVAVDLVNEAKPSSGLRNDRLVAMYASLVATYRAIDPDKILILEAQGGDAAMQGADFSQIADRGNLVWSIHFYYAGGPDDDGYSSGGWVTGHETWDGVSGYPVRDRAALERHLVRAKSDARAAGMALYVGEYGIGNAATNNVAWWQDVADALDRHQVSRAAWEWHSRGSMSITRDDYSFHPYVSVLVGSDS